MTLLAPRLRRSPPRGVAIPPEAHDEPAPPERRRAPVAIDSLNTFRGVGAVWVVLAHLQPDLERLFPAAAPFRRFTVAGHFAVMTFFLMSGFVLAHNYGERFRSIGWGAYGRFLYRRWARIYPVHVFTLFVVLAMVVAARTMGAAHDAIGYGARDFVLNLLLVQAWLPEFRLNWNFPAWSVSCEWFAYLWFPGLVWGMHRFGWRRSAACLLPMAYLFTLGVAFAGPTLPWDTLLTVVGPFVAGVCVAALVPVGTRPNARAAVAANGAGIAFLATPFLVSGATLTVLQLTWSPLLIACLVWAGTAPSRWWTWRPLVSLGEVSYSMYLVQGLALKVLSEVLPSGRYVAASTATRMGVVLAYGTLIAVSTWLCYRLVEAPARRALRPRSFA